MEVLDEESASPGRVTTRRALLLLNRKARNGGLDIADALQVLRDGGIELEERGCDSAASVATTIREGAREFDLVIVGGGDGTLNCAAPGLVETGLPLGVLPLGTANDLARTLGIGPDPVSAARTIVEGRLRAIDLGEVNGRLFFNVASIGFSAELARELTREAKKRWGTLGYALAGARLLARTRPFTAFIEHDGETLKVKTVQIAVGNGRHYGGGLTMDPDAQPDDGCFHVYSLEVDHWWRLVALAPYLKRGTHGSWRDVRAFTTSEVTIRTRRARSVNTDGELTTATPAVFRVRPKAVRVFTPATPGG
ncbi:lipid kinase [Enterovirga sp. CN4-39]|uniref:lipid kinase n=1 Tax=Enterovirga sp. CN4-39 TaxID=3400910 RepID=UPI003C104316